MKKFWKSKKFWLIFLTLIIIGFFFYFFCFSQTQIFWERFWLEKIDSEELKSDESEPSSQIKSPPSGVWGKQVFTINVLDEDLESGIDYTQCQYKVLSYGPDGQERSTGWHKRKCNSDFEIEVGLNKECCFEGKKSCWIFISSKDKADNQHLPAEKKGSVKYYHTDWTAPELGEIFIEQGKYKVQVSDNLKVVACNLYLDNENLGKMSFSVPGCEEKCTAFKSLDLEFDPGAHQIFAVCEDAAGNQGKSKEFLVKENLPPKISSCRVFPTQGNFQTEFKFEVNASDPDQDQLSFKWDFGNGETSIKENPSRKYSQEGTYNPFVEVFDKEGEIDSCVTAWVVVSKE